MGIVYAITNKLSGKTYFGETTRDGETRFNEHLLALSKGQERNKPLQKEFSEIGANCFTFEVIIETNEHKLCELVLVELFSRIGLGYKQRRGDGIQKVINGEEKIPEEVYEQIDVYIRQKLNKEYYYLQLLDELKDIMENGFQSKSDDIFNREFKNLFLVGYKNETRRVDEVRFKKVARIEKRLQKDLYHFTFEEVEEFLYSLNAKSLRSIQNHISRLRKYLQFAKEQGITVNKENYNKNLSKKENCYKYLFPRLNEFPEWGE
ncbi:GIY-YIG nuclease family protein [Bacillus sp. ISL-75]|uniref:phage lytic cycle repressor MrpR family protein n=1 Tax=Bacillus sp. ISL-75 TaxID=2819137 RepID=UPI002034E112|nr:GIY-YIG nuclease family protein [Bacillus sp. ISL-75]